MPAYAIQQPEPRTIPQEYARQEMQARICGELEGCGEIKGTEKNKLKAFLLGTGIRSVTEMDYPLRQAYREYLARSQNIKRPERYLLAYDRVKQYSIREQARTLAGRQQYGWKMEDKILFLPYHPDQAIAMEFDSVRNKPNMVWDFTRPCARTLKQQIFTALNAVVERFKEPRRRGQRLSGLQLLYDFCVEKGIGDIEKMDMAQERAFASWLDGKTVSENRKQQMLPILNFSRREVFLRDEEIHWDANVWYLERLRLPKSRVNPSGSLASVSFLEITRPDNRKYAQQYMKYQFGVTGQSVSTIVIKYNGIRNFLAWLDEKDLCVCACGESDVDTYLDQIEKQGIIAKTFNGKR